LNGLTNKYNIWASTLDKADVDVMKDRIKNGANLLESHVFQMDFLNDNFEDKCPKDLLEIIKNPEKRKKLVVYINPPYAEATTANTVTGTGKNKDKVATSNRIYDKYRGIIGKASNELFAQFFIRISHELSGCFLGEFSKLKILQSSNFIGFRNVFQAKLEKMFAVPADTFDNVKGKFPIGFMIWDTGKKDVFKEAIADIYDKNAQQLECKIFHALDEERGTLNKWITYFNNVGTEIGKMSCYPPDFQNNGKFSILLKPQKRYCLTIGSFNLIEFCIYFSVRYCIEATWLNDRDQFLYPNDGWKNDLEFQSDCLTFTLFHGQNRVTSKDGTIIGSLSLKEKLNH
jgi:hypothetical protein